VRRIDIKEEFIESWDGTRIAVYDTQKGEVVAVLSNGLGGDITAWTPLLEHFKDKIRFISWDYRGLYKSEKPKTGFYEIEHHAKDLEVILNHFGVEKAIFFGWSMGVQVNFEFYRMQTEKFLALIQINGVSGKPFEKAFYGRFPYWMWKLFFLFMQDGMRCFFPLARFLARKSLLLRLASRLKLFTMSEYKDIAKELVLSWLSLDMKEYVKNFSALGRHDAEKILHKISVPTLIIYGSSDLFTPSKFAIDMALKIPKSELVEIKGGSHYTPLEFPDKVNYAVESFLKKYGIIS
jgi:pimeloyl-ACP methyl ester carboxylesterase